MRNRSLFVRRGKMKKRLHGGWPARRPVPNLHRLVTFHSSFRHARPVQHSASKRLTDHLTQTDRRAATGNVDSQPLPHSTKVAMAAFHEFHAGGHPVSWLSHRVGYKAAPGHRFLDGESSSCVSAGWVRCQTRLENQRGHLCGYGGSGSGLSHWYG